MAYVSKGKKAEVQNVLKGIIPVDWKWSLSVQHHSILHLNISKGPGWLLTNISSRERWRYESQFGEEYQPAKEHRQLNPYYIETYSDDPERLALLKKINAAMNSGNYDHSDIMTDYFNVGWYTAINIGKWDKPYQIQ